MRIGVFITPIFLQFFIYKFQRDGVVGAIDKQAGKEKQMNRLVELNTKIKRLEVQLTANQTALAAH